MNEHVSIVDENGRETRKITSCLVSSTLLPSASFAAPARVPMLALLSFAIPDCSVSLSSGLGRRCDVTHPCCPPSGLQRLYLGYSQRSGWRCS